MRMTVRIRERVEIALIYAEDGAYHSSARVLQELADEVRTHAERKTVELLKFAEVKE